MKKLASLLLVALMLGACQNSTQNSNNATQNVATATDSVARTTLVAYFSASEAHITAQVAKTLAEAADADLFEIVPEQVYTAEDLDWHNENSRSSVEMKDSTARPAVASKVENMAQYNTIYVGFPIWWYTAPRIINTFLFNDAINGRTYLYRTGKTIDEFHPAFSIPMLIDMDMVQHIERQIKGKDFYIRTPIWYDRDNEQMMTGRHFIQVCIDSVLPGNSVMPLRVLFTTIDKGEKAMVWMSDNVSVMHGRDFDAMFVASNPRLSYPTITDANWELITRGRVVVGMTKEECRLSLGTPRHINERPDQAGMREYWYYDGGSYLFFVDGLLSEFRR